MVKCHHPLLGVFSLRCFVLADGRLNNHHRHHHHHCPHHHHHYPPTHHHVIVIESILERAAENVLFVYHSLNQLDFVTRQSHLFSRTSSPSHYYYCHHHITRHPSEYFANFRIDCFSFARDAIPHFGGFIEINFVADRVFQGSSCGINFPTL